MKAIITIGISASGKSTWAYKFKRDNNEYTLFERDLYRKYMVYQKKGIASADFQWKDWNWKWEPEITERISEAMWESAQREEDMIISDTNLNPKYRETLIERLTKAGYEIEIKEFPISLEEAWKRDESRPCSVGREAVYKQYQQWLVYKGQEKHVHKGGLPSAILVDIDGTLAHMNGRSPFEWGRVGEDNVDIAVRSIVNNSDESFKVILLSGRDSVCRDETTAWLMDYSVYFNVLHMRKEGDMRPDTVVKKEIYDEHIKDKFNVIFAIEDRPCMVRLWIDLGIKVFNIGNPYLEF